MNLLQKQLNDHIHHWQPGDIVNFGIDLEHTMSDILKVQRDNDIIVDKDDTCHPEAEAWYELDESVMTHQYNVRIVEWELERQLQNGQYYRSVI